MEIGLRPASQREKSRYENSVLGYFVRGSGGNAGTCAV